MNVSSIFAVLALLLMPLSAWGPEVIPEPSSTALFAIGVAAAGAAHWWMRTKK